MCVRTVQFKRREGASVSDLTFSLIQPFKTEKSYAFEPFQIAEHYSLEIKFV